MPNLVIFIGLDPPSELDDTQPVELPRKDELQSLFDSYGPGRFTYTDLKKYNICDKNNRFGHVTFYEERAATRAYEKLSGHKFPNGVKMRLLMRPPQQGDWRDCSEWFYSLESENEEDTNSGSSDSEN